MPLDVDLLRKETRGTQSVTHLNNAGSSLMPRPVLDAVLAHLRREEAIGGYEAAAEASDRLERVRASLAQLVGADSAGIALKESGSSAWASAVSALPVGGRRVLLGRTEYGSNVRVLRRLAEQRGLQLVVLEDDDGGRVSVEHLQQELHRDDVGLVVLTHVPMTGGLVNDAAAVGRLCRAAGVPFVLDACQSVGQLPLDVTELQCDILVGTGRKFLRGPRGTAFVYLNSSMLDKIADPSNEPPTARVLESREAGMATRLGLGRAVEYALAVGIEDIRNRIRMLADGMRSQLASLPGVELHDHGKQETGIVTFSLRARAAGHVKEHLTSAGINVSTVSLPPLTPHAVLQEPATPSTAVRASAHYYNTEAEIGELTSALRRLIN